MSRFIKRFGTKEVRYQIDIVLNKLHMNVIAPDCYIQVVLKRGDHKSELKNTPMLKDKVAKFDKQILSVPTKLYWDEKNQAFLTKLAELQIYIRHQKTQKNAGKIEFDAAEYATKDIKSQKEQRLVSKCPDTTAKLFFEIRVHELGDYSYYNNKEEDDEPAVDRARTKSAITPQQQQYNQRDVSPNISTGYQSARGQPKDLAEFNDRSVSPISKVDRNVTFQNQQMQPQGMRDPPNSARGYNEGYEQKYATGAPTPNSYSAAQQLQQNNFNSLQSAMRKQPTQQQQPSSQSMIGGNDLSSTSDMRNLFKQQKEENLGLNQKIQELIIDNDQLKQQVDNYKNETQRLKSRIATFESQSLSGSSSGSTTLKAHQEEIKSYEDQIKKLQDEIKSIKTQSLKDSDQERQVKEARNESEMKLAELNLKFERERSVFEKKVKDLQMSLEESESNVAELQAEISKKQKDTDYYKALVNRSNREETENEYMLNLQTQLKDLSARNTQFEKETKKRITDLQEENAKLKKDKELEIVDLRRAKTEADHELAKLSRENDLIKKDMKDLNNKYAQAKTALQSYLNKETTDPSSSSVKNKELQAKFEDVNNKLIKLSVERGNIEMERDNLKRELRVRDEEAQRVRNTITTVETRLLNTKQVLADVLNVIMMSGDRDLLDYVEPSLVQFDEETESGGNEITTNINNNNNNYQQQQFMQQSPSHLLHHSQSSNPSGYQPYTNNLIHSQSQSVKSQDPNAAFRTNNMTNFTPNSNNNSNYFNTYTNTYSNNNHNNNNNNNIF